MISPSSRPAVALLLLPLAAASCLDFNDQTEPDAAIDASASGGAAGSSGNRTGGTGGGVGAGGAGSAPDGLPSEVAGGGGSPAADADAWSPAEIGAAETALPPVADAASDRPATADATGWRGKAGVMDIGESKRFNLGSGELHWSIAGGQIGYFYVAQDTLPTVQVASATPVSQCSSPTNTLEGYAGAAALRDLTRVDALPYTAPRSVMFGTRADKCNSGLLVFKQGANYGVIDFLAIDVATSRLTIRYWLADEGVTDFSGAP
jgi:hypothetical protein